MTNELGVEPNNSSDDDSSMDSYGSKLPPEQTLRVGNGVEYYHPMFVAGDKRGHRTAIVLTVRCKGSTKLVLSTGDTLPKTWIVKRTHTLSGDDTTLIDGYKPGQINLFRCLCF